MSKAKIFDVASSDKEAVFDPQEAHTFINTFTGKSPDENYIDTLASTGELGEDNFVVATFKLPLKRYDRDTKSYVEDDDVLRKSEETAQRVFGKSLEELEELGGEQVEFKGYTNGDYGFYEPRKPWIRWAKIDNKLAKQLKSSTGPYELAGVCEHELFHRFEFGFRFTDNEGEEHNVRVSQLAIEPEDENASDNFISTKYTSKESDGWEEKLKTMDDKQAEHVRPSVEAIYVRNRRNAVKTLRNEFGFNVDDLIDNDKTIEIDHIEARRTGNSWWFIGYVTTEDDD